ncbi:MAG: TetR/AcrR family transcriptional regulator [Solirubrobacterales bacterium]
MSPATLTRAERKAETRAALLDSAARLFSRRGLEGTSVEQIVSDAGYTKGAFYANFKSKEELFLVMLDEKYAAELERFEAGLPSDGIPAEEVRAAAEDFIRFVWSDRKWPKLYFEFVAYAVRHPRFRKELAARDRALRERMSAVIRAASESLPADPPFAADDLAMMLFCMANGFVMGQLVEPGLSGELYGTMQATFFRGLAASALGLDLRGMAEAQEALARSSGAGR